MHTRGFFLLLFFLLPVATAQAATYYVATTGNNANPGTQSQPFKTIQKGLDTAVTGDTVLVGNGTYTGDGNTNLTFNGKNLTLRSQGGSANCIIDCHADRFNPRRAFLFSNGETNSAILDGFTVTKGCDTVEGGAIYINGASPTLRNCLFTGNAVSGEESPGGAGSGGVMSIRGDSSPVIARCTFNRNITIDSGGGFGGAIDIESIGTITLSDCIITNNTAIGRYNIGSGGGLSVGSGTVRLVNCILAKNSAQGGDRSFGGGLTVYSPGRVIATNCTITGNDARLTSVSNGAGGIALLGGSAVVTNSIVYGNTALNNLEIGFDGTSPMPTITYSNVRGGFAGQGNIDSDPLFVDAAAGDYRLQAGSPCIGTGSKTASNLPDLDITGLLPRALGGAVEMGAYEYIEPNALFVDGIAGNDTNPGTPASPFRTVARALTAATDPTKVYALYAAAANYSSDRPRVTKSVRFFFWRNTGTARIGAP
jgi:hypothetical protein